MSKPAKKLFIVAPYGEQTYVVPQIKNFSIERDLDLWEVRIEGRLFVATDYENEARKIYNKIWEAIEEFYE